MATQLKYRFPKLNFNVKASDDQEYVLQYRKAGMSLYEDTLTVKTDKDGNVTYISKELLLDDETAYEFKFTNGFDSSKVYFVNFTTNKNLEILDSPYKDKILYAGQNRDFYVNDLFDSTLPTVTGGGILYTFDDNYREVKQNTGNMVPSEGTTFKTAIDSGDSERSLKGLYLKGDNYVKFNDVATNPLMQVTDTYFFGSGDKDFSMLFLFLLEDLTDKVLFFTGNPFNHYQIALDSSKITVTITKDGVSQTVISDSNVIAERLYSCRISIKSGGNGTTDNKIFIYHPTGNISFTGIIDSVPTPSNAPVYIGYNPLNETFHGNFIFSYFYFFPASDIPNSDQWKITHVWDYKPIISFQEVSATTPNPNPIITVPQQWWLKLDNSKIAFVVPPDLPPGQYDHIIQAWNGSNRHEFLDIEVRDAALNVSGAYDIDLSTGLYEDAMDELKNRYYVFHGQWGGANGGVNAHLVYENPSQKTLILEQHGDKYTGKLQGVDKPAKDGTWTGYGVPKIHDIPADPKYGDPWTTRVGACIVSKEYHGYGEYNIRMKVPVGSYGYCPAIWLFHYQEMYPADPRWDYWISRGGKPYGGSDPYMVINHEIDMELPSHLYQGIFASWDELELAYFDPLAIDDQFHIVIDDFNNPSDIGMYRLNDVNNPNDRTSWVKVSDTWDVLNTPKYSNCKFNNWIGEKSSGSGWAYEQTPYEEAEEYLALLTKLDQDYADGQFHTWTIKWYKDRTELWIDGVYVRTNRAFVPSIASRLTIGGWFPSGVSDSSEEYWKPSPERAWAGYPADFDILHLEIDKIQFTPYDAVEAGGVNEFFSESFPEANLRVFES